MRTDLTKPIFLTKQIFFACVFAVGCFGQEPQALDPTMQNNQAKAQPKQEEKLGLFFGVGAGGGIDRMRATWFTQDRIDDQNFGSLVLSAQVGAYHELDPWLSMRYYYSFDLDFNPGDNGSSNRIQAGSSVAGKLPLGLTGYGVFYYNTLNLDFIFKTYQNKTFDFALILGGGAGLISGVYAPKYEKYFYQGNNQFNFIDWDARINAGFRFTFDQQYSIEAMAKFLPLTKLISSWTHTNILRKSSYLLTVNFVMEM